ncbi:signal peptidase I [Nocardioides sp. cx-173]|uniref:signal peptidase I n=1 Tax=Nocardioides sp. cx-173 TaxID=2898796 RepID=UPI001E2A31E4|nr:signal peptidase I [Nocardioides sp. cx-173]MCD4525156.1 signal peptidase I [Nocardioides sp. cx-173]UGB40143.1 signal peptidase I [Nocardioides sp. cx-173]
MTGARRRHRLREWLLTAGALLGVGSILLAVAAAVLGVTPLVFRSGSMAPAVETGDLGIARSVPAAELRPGDIVSVLTSRGVRVTHRVVSAEPADAGTVLVLRGDANEEPDAETYTVEEADRLLFSVPKAGYVAGWLSGTVGVFLAGLLVGGVLLVLLARTRGPRGPRRPDPAEDAHGHGSAPAPTPGRRRALPSAAPPADPAAGSARSSMVMFGLLVVLLSAATLTPRATDTLAAWTDSVAVTASTNAYRVPQPPTLQCAVGGTKDSRIVTLTWLGVSSPATTYVVTVSTSKATPGTVGTVGGTKSVAITFTPSELSNVTVTVTVTPEMTVRSAWKGPARTKQFKVGKNKNEAPTCL